MLIGARKFPAILWLLIDDESRSECFIRNFTRRFVVWIVLLLRMYCVSLISPIVSHNNGQLLWILWKCWFVAVTNYFPRVFFQHKNAYCILFLFSLWSFTPFRSFSQKDDAKNVKTDLIELDLIETASASLNWRVWNREIRGTPKSSFSGRKERAHSPDSSLFIGTGTSLFEDFSRHCCAG